MTRILLLLNFFAFLLSGFGICFLVMSVGFPYWFKNYWQQNINSKLPQDLILKTKIIGSIFTGIGLILVIFVLLFDTHYLLKIDNHTKRKKTRQDIILIERKLKKGPLGGSYYIKKKCQGLGRRKKCKMIKIYTKKV